MPVGVVPAAARPGRWLSGWNWKFAGAWSGGLGEADGFLGGVFVGFDPGEQLGQIGALNFQVERPRGLVVTVYESEQGLLGVGNVVG
jgi:hypothetical protein